ncbi:G-type lectin S-receptor serine/threonine-protein kinase [Spatholobus suberectus]|nr:G-type lectin S-receptor serine/threonine-protein kinase [Spatholobus suberectus]
MSRTHKHHICLLSSLILLFYSFSFCSCSDTISADKAIRDGELLVSKAKTFALGFFSPGKTNSRYVGIWILLQPIWTCFFFSANYNKKTKGVDGKKRIVAILIASVLATSVILLSCVYYLWKRKSKDKVMQHLNQDSPREENNVQSNTHPNLPFFSLKMIIAATRNFGHENKLGQGGFGCVYKGCLASGQEIAVKRLSEHSGQGTEEFKNEVTLLVKLQHRNLVWILWTEGRALDIVDSTLGQSYPPALVLRCIQIGLLCVQENAINRPSMLEVVFMLGNETPLSPPQKPAFLFNGNQDLPESSPSGGGSSINEVTATTISAR